MNDTTLKPDKQPAESFHCNGCKQTVEGKPQGWHFESKFCGPCWEAYKARNSRKCMMCRKPLYECYC